MKRKKISANEVNKFCYCNYQWYYERLYGISEIRRINSEYCRENGFISKTSRNFERGKKFHNNYIFKYKLKVFLKFVLILAVIALLFYCFIYHLIDYKL